MLTAGQRKEHIMNRVGYGPGVWASKRYDTLGARDFVTEQLTEVLPAITQGGVFIESKVERSVVEQRQLEAVLLDFWYNHFNVNASTNRPQGRENIIGRTLADFQNVAIGSNVLGRFADMLIATAKTPAMLRYLDNYLNRKPQVFNDGRVVGYNENYAREVMELHTIGVNGGYDEDDVLEVTRILTGWTYRGQNGTPPNSFAYFDARHDDGAKTVMGVDYPAGGGIEEGESLLTFLATHRSAANFLSYKLCTRFVGDSPPAATVTAAADRFELSGGNLQAVMATILRHPTFMQADVANFRSKVKPPHRYVASALLAMGATQAAHWSEIEEDLTDKIIAASDAPYFFAPPTGYPEAAGYWLSTVSMLQRFEIAEMIAYDDTLLDLLEARAAVIGVDIADSYLAIRRVLLPGGTSADTENAVKDHVAANAMTNRQRMAAIAHMLFCSPEFMRY